MRGKSLLRKRSGRYENVADITIFFGSNLERVLAVFLRNPTTDFQLRELKKMTMLGEPTIKRALDILNKRGIIKRREGKIYPYYEADRDSDVFKTIKLARTLFVLNAVVKEVSEKTRPNCMVLFGSAAKGEDTEKSDIDIFVQARRYEFNFSSAEKRLDRKINLVFESDTKKLSSELLNNLANGITLYGFLEVR